MPIKKNLAQRTVQALVAVALAVAALPGVAAAETGDACPAQPLAQSFLEYGDLNYYFLAPGGDFESRGVWTVSGRYEYAEREDELIEFAGEQALILGSGARATSPSFCVDATYPHLRLGAQAYSRDGTLTIEAVEPSGEDVTLATLDGDDFRSPALSGYVPLASKLGLETGDKTQVQLRFTARGWWGADFVSIDPRRAR